MSGEITIFQSALGWLYLFLCLTLVWYCVLLLVNLLRWVRRQAGFRKTIGTMTKLLLSLAITRAVVWLGVNFQNL